MKQIWIFILGGLLACREIPDEEMFIAPNDDRPDQEGWNAEVIVTNNGLSEMIIRYHYMRRWERKQLMIFSGGFTVDMFEQNRHTAVLTADSGWLRRSMAELVAIGNVVVISDSGVTLRAGKLFWDESTKKIRTEGFVQITTEEDTLNGYDFESDRNLQNWKIRRAFGQSGRDVDLRTGTVRSRRKTDHSEKLREGMEEIIRDEP